MIHKDHTGAGPSLSGRDTERDREKFSLCTGGGIQYRGGVTSAAINIVFFMKISHIVLGAGGHKGN